MLRSRWLGRVPYKEALDLQRALFRHGRENHLLLLEHPDVYTLGRSADLGNVLIDVNEVGAELLRVDRGGDVTYHGPGQLVGYPVVSVPGKRGGGMADTAEYVHSVEQLIIDSLNDLAVTNVGRLDRFHGVWVDPISPNPRKIAAVGVRLSRGRSMHGFALNVDPNMAMFGHIVACGITDKSVTSMRSEGFDVEMNVVVDAIVARAAHLWGAGVVERQDVVWRKRSTDLAPFSRGEGPGAKVAPGDHGPDSPVPRDRGSITTGLTISQKRSRSNHRTPGTRLRKRLDDAGVGEGLAIETRKPEWLRAKANMGAEYRELKRTMRSHELVTVCEQASCPNIFECWAEGTATFMINGERCTRACGFCHVDTRLPAELDASEPDRVAAAVSQMQLEHSVITAVARDDLDDGGAGAFALTIKAIASRSPSTTVEVLIPDFSGDGGALDTVLDAGPSIVNHNLETVARMQRAVRPSAGYARSLAVLARVKARGLVAKSGLIVGMGETEAEIEGALADLAGVGCDIVTIGQYLRPTSNHLPVDRWVFPEQFESYRSYGLARGISHVESSPLTRSSYHAGSAAALIVG